ncbi:hypothetical protein HZB05_01615 [Candidatus Wolfebacteria bacterium]|nr:hypothetical protein [Candidatus Wolfebacteria bacterium]
MIDKNYIKTIKERGKESHVYRKFQLIGLEIANLLDDNEHKSLYIKLAKEKNPETLLAIAKDVAERKQIGNKGGYFMKILQTKFPKKPKKAAIKKKNGKSKNINNKK